MRNVLFCKVCEAVARFQCVTSKGRLYVADAILQVRSWLNSTGSIVVSPESSDGALVVDRNRQAGTGGNRKSTSVWLCTMCDHISSGAGDAGWGCGYRNTQMLLSSLMHDLTYNNVLFDGEEGCPCDRLDCLRFISLIAALCILCKMQTRLKLPLTSVPRTEAAAAVTREEGPYQWRALAL